MSSGIAASDSEKITQGIEAETTYKVYLRVPAVIDGLQSNWVPASEWLSGEISTPATVGEAPSSVELVEVTDTQAKIKVDPTYHNAYFVAIKQGAANPLSSNTGFDDTRLGKWTLAPSTGDPVAIKAADNNTETTSTTLTAGTTYDVFSISTNGETYAGGKAVSTNVVKIGSFKTVYGYNKGITSSNFAANYNPTQKLEDAFGLKVSVNAVWDAEGKNMTAIFENNRVKPLTIKTGDVTADYVVPTKVEFKTGSGTTAVGSGTVSEATAEDLGFGAANVQKIYAVVTGVPATVYTEGEGSEVKFNKIVVQISVDGVTPNGKKVADVSAYLYDPIAKNVVSITGWYTTKTFDTPAAFKSFAVDGEELSGNKSYPAGTRKVTVTASTNLFDPSEVAELASKGYEIADSSTKYSTQVPYNWNVAVTADDGAVLTLNEADIQYGEKGAKGGVNEKLYDLLKVTLQASGNTIKKGTFDVEFAYTVSEGDVKPLVDKAKGFDATSFNKIVTSSSSNTLQSYDAGTRVFIAAQAKYAGNAVAWAVIPVTISKRKVALTFQDSEYTVGITRKAKAEDFESAITVANSNGKERKTDAQKKLSANFAGSLFVEPIADNENFDSDLAAFFTGDKGSAAISENITIDISSIDQMTAGQINPYFDEEYNPNPGKITAATGLTKNFDKNFEVDFSKSYAGLLVDGKGSYEVKFMGSVNGELKELASYKLDGLSGTLETVLGAASENDLKAFKNSKIDTVSMAGFLDPKTTKLTGWDVVYSNATVNNKQSNAVNVGGLLNYNIGGTYNYVFTARIQKHLTDKDAGIVISTIPNQTYDGRKKVYNGLTDTANQNASIPITVRSDTDGDGALDTTLTYNVDYTVTYKNNQNASVVLNEDGSFKQAQTDLKKRPYITIKGKGTYKGYS